MDYIILRNGALAPLTDWQDAHSIPAGKLSQHFSISEYHIGRFRPFTYSEILLELAEAFRVRVNAPVVIGSGYRTKAYQKKLQGDKNISAALISPHCEGMAFDIDAESWEQTKEYVLILQAVAKELGIKIRIGYKEYWNKHKQTFVHTDVCPEYFAKGMPYYDRPHPEPWERVTTW